MHPRKIGSINKFGYPITKKDVRSFLGMVGCYRSFIADFAGILQGIQQSVPNSPIPNIQ